jgi:hypothetical protein
MHIQVETESRYARGKGTSNNPSNFFQVYEYLLQHKSFSSKTHLCMSTGIFPPPSNTFYFAANRLLALSFLP